DELRRLCPVATQPLRGDCVGHEDARREPADQVVLERRPLVVEHRRVGDAQRAADGRQLRGGVGQPVFEAPAAREAHEPRDAVNPGAGLACLRGAAMVADRNVGMSPGVEQVERVRERPSRDLHLMAVPLESLHERPQHDRMGDVCHVDPDAHGAALYAATDSGLAAPGPGHASEMADPKDEIQQLLNYLLPYAEEMLSKDGEFYPYAATMDA